MSKKESRATKALLVLAMGLATMFVFSSTASAGHYHNNCVDHGLVHGSSTTDNSWHSRVEGGCGNPGMKSCLVRTSGYTYYASYIGTGNPATCNQWSNYCCGEQSSYATVDFNAVFSSHNHFAH